MTQENLRWVKKTRIVFVHRSMMTMLKDSFELFAGKKGENKESTATITATTSTNVEKIA